MTQAVSDFVSLSGKVVVVTGGAQGIGLAIAQLAIQCGAQVVSFDLPRESGDAPQGAKGCVCLEGDVSSEDDCKRLMEATQERFGRVDVLVNNAGVLEESRSTLKQNLASWKRVMDVNLQGTFLMSQAAARAMVSQGSPGAIINISSVVGLAGFRAANAYGASKAGVAMLTRTLSVDLAPRQIRVNAVAPGFIDTAMSANIKDNTKIERDAYIRRIPLGRFGEATEIARAVVFLASDHASYITGAVLPVDGGWLAFGGPSNE
jgi:NAD(P)-dependent dehydrogenase (short-subunit alcohol dehydrogenase family)